MVLQPTTWMTPNLSACVCCFCFVSLYYIYKLACLQKCGTYYRKSFVGLNIIVFIRTLSWQMHVSNYPKFRNPVVSSYRLSHLSTLGGTQSVTESRLYAPWNRLAWGARAKIPITTRCAGWIPAALIHTFLIILRQQFHRIFTSSTANIRQYSTPTILVLSILSRASRPNRSPT